MNIHKCQSMRFMRCRSSTHYRYNINCFKLLLVTDHIRDLGFILCPTLNPHLHIETISCKAFKMLGFLKRNTSDFKLSTSLKALYCSLVRSTLEYGSVVWDPSIATGCHQLERVQNKLLKHISFIQKIECPPHDYQPVLKHLDLDSLAES